MELLVPLIGFNNDERSTLPLSDVFQEAMSFAFHCASLIEPEALSRVRACVRACVRAPAEAVVSL